MVATGLPSPSPRFATRLCRFLIQALCLGFVPFLSLTPASADDDILFFVPALAGLPADSAAIGPAGGTLRAGAASVTVVSGTFDASVQMTLATSRTAPDFLGRPASRIYDLGIETGRMDKDLAVALSGFGGPDRDVVVAVAERADYDADRATARPAMVAGQVRSGVLRFTLPATETQAASNARNLVRNATAPDTPTRTGFTFWAVSGFNTMESTHFRLYYPASIQADADMAQIILNDAEDAYTRLHDMGFLTTGLSLPLVITVEAGMGTRDGEAGIPLSGKAGQYLNLNVNLCAPTHADKLRATIGHEFFHIVQNLYDPRSALRIRHPRAHPYFLWLSEASSVWFESVVLDSSTYVADVFTSNIDMYRQGPETFVDHAEAQSIGYYASGFLRHLTDARGSNTLVYDIWKEVRDEGRGTSDYSDLTAVVRAVGSAVTTGAQWTDFVQRLLSKTSGHGGWPEPSASDSRNSYGTLGYVTAWDFSAALAPFSAAKWKVGFNKINAGDTDYFARVDSSDSIEYAVFKGTGKPPSYGRLGTVSPGAPLNFSVTEGDSVIVTASNSDTTPPYQTPRNAAVHIGLKDTCRYCPGIPATATLYLATERERLWRHATKGHQVAYEVYWDTARTVIAQAECYEYETGCSSTWSTWYENGNREWERVFDCDGQANGVLKHYYGTGVPDEFTTYAHGLQTGAYTKYYENGNYQITGYKTNGAWTGTWTWYDENGTPIQVCTDMGTSSQNCSTPD